MLLERPDTASNDCKVLSSIIARAGDKWSVLIVVLLADNPRRFNELKREVGGISQRMLTFTLRGLERDGLIIRTVYPTTPPRVEYALTALGATLWRAIEPLANWARRHMDEIIVSRRVFDDTPKIL